MSGPRKKDHIKVLSCPSCGRALWKGYFAKSFECPYCHTKLTSNIVTVTNWEGVLALFLLWIPFSLITRLVGETLYLNWLILIALALAMHVALLSTFVHLERVRE